MSSFAPHRETQQKRCRSALEHRGKKYSGFKLQRSVKHLLSSLYQNPIRCRSALTWRLRFGCAEIAFFCPLPPPRRQNTAKLGKHRQQSANIGKKRALPKLPFRKAVLCRLYPTTWGGAHMVYDAVHITILCICSYVSTPPEHHGQRCFWLCPTAFPENHKYHALLL